MATTDDSGYVRVGDAEEVREAGRKLVRADGRHVAVFYHEGEFHAVDNRCPHMGFPLMDGTVDDGILTCHWHHARFELSCGDTFDPFADDVPSYPVEVRDGDVYVDPYPDRDRDPVEHWTGRLETGLQENLSLVVAKSVVGLEDAGVDYTGPLRVGVEFGTEYREDGWGRGLTTLGVMANLVEDVRPEDRRRALYTGLTEVASNVSGEPPFFEQKPLQATDVSPERLNDWFRENVEVRDSDGAERVLRAAIRSGLDESEVAAMLFGAATDHLYLDTGHRLDFINTAFETLDHLGWEYAEQVLPTLVPGLAAASRAEENSSWRQPIDVAELLFDTCTELPSLVETGASETWEEPEDFVETLLGEDPHTIVDELAGAVATGATAEELAEVVTYAAARRIAQFGTSNEFGDWNTVHHTFTYANAVHGAARRTDAWEVYRGVFDAAMNVYLDRFLNTPPAPIPDPEGDRDPDAVVEDLKETFEVERDEEVDRAGRLTAEYLASGGDVDRLKSALGEVLLREDAGFHPNQNLEAVFNQLDYQDDPDRRRVFLVAGARYLSAHTPTRREAEQTFRIAERLNRGEKIHEADGEAATADD
ncbi:ferredoxin [Halobacteriales archaeon QS_1_68_20]|nr:MAG: ferredoxin [Halobacteriales archaeon QS_1_68_20]